MNSDHVKASVASYFRYKRQCPIIAFERGITGASNPDILVVTKNRKLVEIEVKVNIYDLKNDIKKRVWAHRNVLPNSMPYQFYYAVPTKLHNKALVIIEEWNKEGKIAGKTGLIAVRDKRNIGWNDVYVIKKAPINKACKKLTLRQMVKMVYNQSATLSSYAVKFAKQSLNTPDKPIPPKGIE